MVKIAHFADTHIRNLKYHKEYRKVFEEMYEALRKEKVDYIVHCGDIAHTKTQISPEYVEMCREFLNNLADIAPTHVILGNHDGNLKNSFRMDAVSPIAAALKQDWISPKQGAPRRSLLRGGLLRRGARGRLARACGRLG